MKFWKKNFVLQCAQYVPCTATSVADTRCPARNILYPLLCRAVSGMRLWLKGICKVQIRCQIVVEYSLFLEQQLLFLQVQFMNPRAVAFSSKCHNMQWKINLKHRGKASIQYLENFQLTDNEKQDTRTSNLKLKAVLIAFFNIRYILIKCVPSGQSVNQRYCMEIPTKPCESVRKRMPDQWGNDSWTLHRDRPPNRNVFLVHESRCLKTRRIHDIVWLP